MNFKKSSFILAITGLVFIATSSFAKTERSFVADGDQCHQQAKKGTILEMAKASGKFNTFLKAIEVAGLTESIEQATGPITVFAPTDDAFKLLNQSEIDELMNDKEFLKDVLLYHVVDGRLSMKDATAREVVRSVEGDDLFFYRDEKGYSVNEARILCADIEATNGIVHVIDYVLFPIIK